VLQSSLGMLSEILNQHAGGLSSQWQVFTSIARQCGDLEVLQQGLPAVAILKSPVFIERDGGAKAGKLWIAPKHLGSQRVATFVAGATLVADHNLRRSQAVQLAQQRLAILIQELGGGHVAGGDVHVGYPCHMPIAGDTHKIVVALVSQEPWLYHRTRGNHADHLARHEPVLWLVTELLTDGHLVTSRDQPGDVCLSCMVRYAGHGHTLALGHVTGGQDDIQLLGDDMSIRIKGLVKVPEPEKDDGIRVLPLDVQILLANWSDRRRGGHSRSLR